jgi:hypothetical protein
MGNVQPGTYRLTAERVGFLRQQYGARTPGGTGSYLNLAASQSLRNIEIRLTPQGVIMGTVLDEEGDPQPRAMVVAYKAGSTSSLTRSGRGGVQTGGSTSTNDIGQFRIADLAPGSYYLVATGQSRGGRGGMNGPGRGGQPQTATESEEDVVPTYFPSSLDIAGAATVEVSAGQENAGLSIVLRTGMLHRVSGRVVGVSAQDAGRLRVSLVSRGVSGMPAFMMGGTSATVRQDGSFEASRVQSGSYYVVAERIGGGGRGAAGQQVTAGGAAGVGGPGGNGVAVGRSPLDVAGDVSNVVVSLVEPVAVSGTVKVEGQQTQTAASTAGTTARTQTGAGSQSSMSLSLTPVENVPGMPGGNVTVRVTNNSFNMAAVTPNHYYVGFSGLPAGSYLKSVRLNNQEVIEKGIDLSGGGTAVVLDVTLSMNGGAIEGTVTDDGKPATGSNVIILADPLRPGQMYLNRTTTTDQDGKFTLTGLAPGGYKLYAFAEAQPEIVADLDQIKPYEGKATSARVTEGSSGQVELRVIKPEDAQ